MKMILRWINILNISAWVSCIFSIVALATYNVSQGGSVQFATKVAENRPDDWYLLKSSNEYVLVIHGDCGGNLNYNGQEKTREETVRDILHHFPEIKKKNILKIVCCHPGVKDSFWIEDLYVENCGNWKGVTIETFLLCVLTYRESNR